MYVGPRGRHAVERRASLSQPTHLPRFFWFLLWLAATLAAVAVGGKMLVMPGVSVQAGALPSGRMQQGPLHV